MIKKSQLTQKGLDMRSVMTWMLLGVLTLLYGAVGQVTLVVGNAHVVRASQTLPASSGMVLEERDVVNTQEGQVQLRFADDTIVSLGKHTHFSIDTYLNDATAPQVKFGVAQGAFGVMTGKIGKVAPQNFNIQTRTATIGIRGTHIKGRTSEGGDTIGCLRGAIRVTSLATGRSVDVPAGRFTRILPGQDPASPQQMTPEELGEMGDDAGEGSAQGGAQGEGGAPSGEDAPQGSPPPLAQAASDNQKEQAVLEHIGRLGEGGGCGAGYVGTSPNCQPITTAYVEPAYWTAPLSANAPASEISLQGFATSLSGTMFKHNGVLELNMAGFGVDDDSRIDIDSGIIWLERASDQQTMSYFNLNRFSILGIDANSEFWLQSENTVTNDYVSWGYWQVDAHMNPVPVLNFWVAGLRADDAEIFVNDKIADMSHMTTYTYNGKSIGYVHEGGTYVGIDAVTNNTVLLAFEFGGGASSLQSQSYIQFQTNGQDPQVWRLDGLHLEGYHSGVFSVAGITAVGGVEYGETTQISGKFYGTEAQALGGAFQATADEKTAIGVFKAVR